MKKGRRVEKKEDCTESRILFPIKLPSLEVSKVEGSCKEEGMRRMRRKEGSTPQMIINPEV